jgi:hypothetical protein
VSHRVDSDNATQATVWLRRISLWGGFGALALAVVVFVVTSEIVRAAPLLFLGVLALFSAWAAGRKPQPTVHLARVALARISSDAIPDLARDALLACCRVRHWIVRIDDGTGFQGRTDPGVRSFGEWVTVTWEANPNGVTVDIMSRPRWAFTVVDWGKNGANVRRVAARLLEGARRAGAVEVSIDTSGNDAPV